MDALVTRETAAALVGVKPRTIDSWVDRGRLVRTMTGKRGLALYRIGAVFEAERKTRRASLRIVLRSPRLVP